MRFALGAKKGAMRQRHARTSNQARLKARACLAVLVAAVLALPALAQASAQPLYFWGSVAATVKAPGVPSEPEVIRPSLIFMAADGSWVIERLHWSGWGSSVAHASGVSSASDDIPNVADGKRIKHPASVTLSDPGRFGAHEVYRCFTLSVLRSSQLDQTLCLGHEHSFYGFAPAKHPAPAPTAPIAAADFFAGNGISCSILDQPGFASEDAASCESRHAPSGGGELLVQRAELELDGHIVSCTGSEAKCELGNPGIAPTYQAGKVVTVGAFTCKVLATGVECTVIATGRGFLITPERLTEVGG
jgi:hypothetical protein